MKVLVTGSRTWTNRRQIIARLLALPDGTTIIEGGARGADEIARFTAKALGFHVITFEADWSMGRKAGPIRNRRMLDLRPDWVIAFCKDASAGTMNCVQEARARGIPVEFIEAGENAIVAQDVATALDVLRG